MHRTYALTLILLSFGAVAPCGAAIVTVNPLNHPSGTDISSAYSGLNVRVLQNTPGTNTYTPIASPALAETCTSYGPCPGFGPLASIGGITANGHVAEGCYNVTNAGGTASVCGMSWKTLELNFPQGTDFIEISAVWNIDAPGIIAYDTAGNQLLYCKPSSAGSPLPSPGSFPGCIISQQLAPSQEFIGTFRLQTASPVIARVVFASMDGSAIATGIQYSWINPRLPCDCKKPPKPKDLKSMD